MKKIRDRLKLKFRFNKKITQGIAFVLVVSIIFSSIHISSLTARHGNGAIDTYSSHNYVQQMLHGPSSVLAHYINTRAPQNNYEVNPLIEKYVRAVEIIEQAVELTIQGEYALAQEKYFLALYLINECIEMFEEYRGGLIDDVLLTDLWLKKGSLHVILGDYENGLSALNFLLDFNPEVSEAYLVKAQIFETLGMYSEMNDSLRRYMDIMQIEETDKELYIELWLNRGNLHILLNEHDDAIYAINRVLNVDDTQARAHLLHAQAYADLNMFQEMSLSLEQYLNLEPSDDGIRELLAEVIEELNRPVLLPATGPVVIEESQNILEENIEELLSSELSLLESEFLLGLYAMQEGNFIEAEAAISRAIALDPYFEGLHYHRGICRLNLEDYIGAADDFMVSISQGYMVQHSLFNRGIGLILADEYELGLEDIRQAVLLNESPEVRERAESFLLQVEEAEREALIIHLLTMAQAAAEIEDLYSLCYYLEAYLEIVPDDIDIRTLLAHSRFANVEFEKAMEQYALLMEKGLVSEFAYYFGMSALQLFQFEVAEEAFSEALNAEEPYSDIHYFRGVARMALEDYRGAVNDFTASIRNGEMVQGSFFNRGISRLMMDRNRRGIEDISRAAGMSDDTEIREQAQQILKELESDQ